MRILLASEEITAQPSEGLLVFAMHLCRYLNRTTELTALHAFGDPEPALRSMKLLSPRILITRGLFGLFRHERFDIVIYIPSSGLTPFGLWRALLLKRISKIPIIVIALQERRVGRFHGLISQIGAPDVVLTPVDGLRTSLDRLGINVEFIMPGYDGKIFKPVSGEEKERLRRKYDLPSDRHIVLHVGHVRESRNMQLFLRYREWGVDVLPVIKAGESDRSWLHRLRTAGIIVIDEYIEHMNELYQAADSYLFPVNCPTGALEFPLSVIEASACNLPVLTTRFGALPEVIPEGGGFHYFTNASEIPGLLQVVRSSTPETSPKVRDFTWEMVFERYLVPQINTITRRKGGG